MTVLSTAWVGVGLAAGFDPRLLVPDPVTHGPRLALFVSGAVTFALPLIAILLAHELGHYLTCRRYGIDASPPYFIPFPFFSLAGTLGAFIRIRQPIRDKKSLFDMAVAGPIAGFVVALPVLAYGIAKTRPVFEALPEDGLITFQYPLVVRLLQLLVSGHTFASADVVEHPAFIAGWFGLLVTAINLIPAGQLDGGHALYAVAGRRQKYFRLPVLVILVVMGFFFPGWWVWAALLLLLIGLKHPPVDDESTPLDSRRKAVAALVVLIFVLCFAPVPIREGGDSPRRRPVRERRGTVVHQLDLHGGPERPG